MALNKHLKGIRQSETGNQEVRQTQYVGKDIWDLDSAKTPITAIASRTGSIKVSDPSYKHFEQEDADRWVRINDSGGINSSVGSIGVDDVSAFRVGDVCLIDNERVIVTALDATNGEIDVTRGYVDSTAAAHDDNAWVKVLFAEQTEHGSSGTPIDTDPVTKENNVQIFKEFWGESGTNQATKKYGPNQLGRQMANAMKRLRRDQEQMLLWGKKKITRSSGVITRYSGGLDEFVTSNRLDLEGSLELGDIAEIINQSTFYGGDKKLWFVGRDALYQLSSLGMDWVRIDQATKTLGMSVNRVRGPHGEFSLIEHKDLTNAHGGHIFIVDPKYLKFAILRPIKRDMNIQDNDVDGVKHQFKGELGVWVGNEKAHMICTNAGGEIY